MLYAGNNHCLKNTSECSDITENLPCNKEKSPVLFDDSDVKRVFSSMHIWEHSRGINFWKTYHVTLAPSLCQAEHYPPVWLEGVRRICGGKTERRKHGCKKKQYRITTWNIRTLYQMGKINKIMQIITERREIRDRDSTEYKTKTKRYRKNFGKRSKVGMKRNAKPSRNWKRKENYMKCIGK